MSLIAELQRRHVLKVGAAYLVVAWVVVQVASIAFPAFAAPPWVLRVFILIAMLGLPVALAMAWAFEMTPAGLRHEPAPLGNKRVFGTAGALVVLAMAWYAVGQPATRSAPASTAPPARAAATATTRPEAPLPAPVPRSIAVLPFVNMSADPENAYFSDGISEELLNALVRVPGLEVASRTSSFAYRGRADLGAERIARELRVAHLLAGSVRKSGNRVRITVQLIDAANDRHAWSQTYDRELDDIFAIQGEIASAIVEVLRVKLAPGEHAAVVRADTGNMQAYEAYLKGRELFIARRDLPEAFALFERAVELDPQFARGWEGLAAVGAVIRTWGYDDRDYLASVRPAAERALALDPSLSMPWASLAELESNTWPMDFEKMLSYYDKAVALDPRNATARLWRGITWLHLGYFDRALVDFDYCLALEPGYHNCRSHKAMTLLFRGDEDAAIALFERTVADGAFHSRMEHFVAPLLRRGNRTAAVLLLDEIDIALPLRTVLLEHIARNDRPHPQARALVEAHLAAATSPRAKALAPSSLYLWLGDLDGVAANDDIAMDPMVTWDRDPPRWRNSSAMKGRLVRSGALAYWREHGFPPQCRALGKDDFSCR